MQVLLFTAVWLLCDRRTLRHRGTAFVAGLVPRALAGDPHRRSRVRRRSAVRRPVVWLRAERSERRSAGLRAAVRRARRRRRRVARVLGSARLRSRLYLRTLRGDLEQLRARRRRWRSSSPARWLPACAGGPDAPTTWRPGSGTRCARPVSLAAGVVLLGGFGAWIARPHLQTVRGAPNIVVKAVQIRTHLPVDPTRRYFEHSVQWVSWYIGPITLTLAILGAAYATCAFVRGSLARCRARSRRSCSVRRRCSTSGGRASRPIRSGSTRRFLPAVFPVLVLAAFGALCVLADRDRFGRASALRRVIAVGLGVLRGRVSRVRDPGRLRG